MAKKIKNGARKIVLEKAEEARIAAFSAFKSLGINVPQFPEPPLSTSAGNSLGQGGATSSDNGSNDSLHSVEHAGKPSAEDSLHLENNVSVTKEKLKKALETNVVASEVNSTIVVPHKFRPDDPRKVLIEGSFNLQNELGATVGHSKDFNSTQLIQLPKQGDRIIINNAATDSQTGEGQSGIKVNSSKKGPIHASNIPGGFDSFLDLWDSTSEFYFDVHCNKRSEVNSSTPFEVHGIAICWENSDVYYINLPKDLVSPESKINDCLHVNASGDKSDPLPSDYLIMVRKRWSRISGIMGKKDVRKYTWNLKVQVQAFRSPAVLIQKFAKKLAAENTEFEVTDNSFLILTPIFIRVGIDLCIVSWILWPDEERSSSPNLEKVIWSRR